MVPRVLTVDDDGLTLDRSFDGSLDVHFDGWRGWSVAVERREPARAEDATLLVPWPKRLKAKLDGRSLVTVTAEGEELYRGEVAFG